MINHKIIEKETPVRDLDDWVCVYQRLNEKDYMYVSVWMFFCVWMNSFVSEWMEAYAREWMIV